MFKRRMRGPSHKIQNLIKEQLRIKGNGQSSSLLWYKTDLLSKAQKKTYVMHSIAFVSFAESSKQLSRHNSASSIWRISN